MLCNDCKKNDGHYEGAFKLCQNPTPDGGACLNPNYWGYSFVTVRIEPIARPGGNEYVVRATHKDYPGVAGVAPCPAPDCDDSEAERLALENLIARLATDALVGATKPIAKTMESREIVQRDLEAARSGPTIATLADRLRLKRRRDEARTLRVHDRISWSQNDYLQVSSVARDADGDPTYIFDNVHIEWDVEAVAAALNGELTTRGKPKIVRRELLGYDEPRLEAKD